ncbi:hypothetical protein FFWV33_09430 [Flavobacterium faecale]|uniref:Uncharacterized protein n=2 Tax=Flavobacterium faecale TaxID=1355330 RepID=A0A2S1LDB5_9FLAO|nr:hypothetical protein FFWV33_09430 [Flavobacterium faecale]
MRYLFFGVFSIFILTINIACTEDSEYIVKADFIYFNDTNYVIELISSAKINPNSSLKISFEGEGSKTTDHNSYVPPYPFGDGTVIKYDDIKCDFLNPGTKAGRGEGPSGIQNYEFKKISERYYEFTFRFTEADFEQAENCN